MFTKFSSRDVTLIPAMAVTSAIGHVMVGPIVNRTLHLPGPTLAGVLIMAPLLIAGALTLKKGSILLSSTLNGIVLSIFVPIGVLAVPIYFLVGVILEILFFRLQTNLFLPSYSFLTSGTANAFSVFLIAVIGIGIRNVAVISFAVTLGFISGAFGGIISWTLLTRITKTFSKEAKTIFH